ncbi:FAD dependent oxidoreductase [Aureococcus anophagefferens]|nr:FAD dependent oxidoreductase [Aureococcus anophagefferens]
MSELLPPVRSDSASSSRRSDSRNSATFEEGGLFGASSSAAGLLESAGRDGGVCDDDDVSESPTMGEDFYKGVEGFLAKPAPTLRHFCKGPPPGGQSLPVLRKQRSDLRRGKVPGAAPAAKPQRRPRGDDGDHVDVAKVAEALQPQKAEFSASSAKAARDPRRVAPGEVDALVRNFEEGTSLTELRPTPSPRAHVSARAMSRRWAPSLALPAAIPEDEALGAERRDADEPAPATRAQLDAAEAALRKMEADLDAIGASSAGVARAPPEQRRQRELGVERDDERRRPGRRRRGPLLDRCDRAFDDAPTKPKARRQTLSGPIARRKVCAAARALPRRPRRRWQRRPAAALRAPKFHFAGSIMASARRGAAAVVAVGAYVLVTRKRAIVTRLQRWIADASSGGGWTNLGCGDGGGDYAAACEALCRLVARDVPPRSRVLSVGCGRGAELACLAEAASCVTGSPRRFYDAVLAVDAAYHFGAAEEARFFAGAADVLFAGGVFACSHVCVREGAALSFRDRLLLWACDVHPRRSRRALAAAVAAAGFSDVAVETVPRVLDRWPFLGALPLDYVVVRATVAAGKPRGPRVAVVGAGLSGLVCARALSATCDVTVFERAAHVGFASQSVAMAGGVVDVPLRMIGQGYYDSLEKVCAALGVPTTRATVDCSFADFGKAAHLRYSASRVANFLELRGRWAPARSLTLAPGRDGDGAILGAWKADRGLDAASNACVLHADARLMPTDRRDWRALNVTGGDGDGGAAMLTVWLNRYYPEHAFDGDVFQTWNPHVEPEADRRLSPDLRLPRVVQSWPETPKIQARVAELQGVGGFYFAGAHAVPGMGLLEQACQAGETAAARVLADLAA